MKAADKSSKSNKLAKNEGLNLAEALFSDGMPRKKPEKKSSQPKDIKEMSSPKVTEADLGPKVKIKPQRLLGESKPDSTEANR
jgi:hypothetical protein